MPLDISLRWAALGVLLLFNIFFAISETSLFALKPLDRLRLKQESPSRGKMVEELLSQSHRLLITIILGVEFVTILASIVGTSLAITWWGDQGKWLALVVISPSLLLFGEIIPKSLALTFPTRLAPRVAPCVRWAITLFTPLRVILVQLSRGVLVTLGFRPDLQVPAVQQEDFVRMVDESFQGGMIAALERDFIQNLLSFGEVRVSQIMVPRPDIFCLPLDMPVHQMVRAVKKSRYSRIPIYEDEPGNVLGILHAKELLHLCTRQDCNPEMVRNILRAPYYVPENKKAFDLLTELQSQRLRLALVVDEYGTLVGLVTVEDLLEQLCGEIPQEFEAEEKLIREQAPGRWRVNASLSLEDLEAVLGKPFPPGEFDTVGGFVLDLFGELPREGDTVTYDSFRFKVLKMKGTRIMELEIEQIEP
uniref:HlyC/CorC family transporter n=1 Tax=Desulfobacca acetoxidans TaxID=60893 RepID=A0A7V6A311_9BACT